jgi:hypothetical protein
VVEVVVLQTQQGRVEQEAVEQVSLALELQPLEPQILEAEEVVVLTLALRLAEQEALA